MLCIYSGCSEASRKSVYIMIRMVRIRNRIVRIRSLLELSNQYQNQDHISKNMGFYVNNNFSLLVHTTIVLKQFQDIYSHCCGSLEINVTYYFVPISQKHQRLFKQPLCCHFGEFSFLLLKCNYEPYNVCFWGHFRHELLVPCFFKNFFSLVALDEQGLYRHQINQI